MTKKHYPMSEAEAAIIKAYIHFPGIIQSVDDDRNGRFHTACNRIMKKGRRAVYVEEVTCKQCLESPLVQKKLARKMAERLKDDYIKIVE